EDSDDDNDGILDDDDDDVDGDGIDNVDDAFPEDKSESIDTDGDGIGDNRDNDDDDDGLLDIDDEFPFDATNNPILVNRLENLAIRGFVGTGEQVLIAGLVITGTEPKTILIRARGPALANSGLANILPDPQLALLSGVSVIDSNDDWQEHRNMNLIPEKLQPSDVQEAAILTTLDPGAYTAIVSGVNGEEGIGLVEVFELSDTALTRLANIAMRGFVGTADDVLIAGLVISGRRPKALVIRAKGPSLAAAGIKDVLEDPKILLISGTSLIDSNDNWRDHDRAAEVPQQLQPSDDLEAVIYTVLEPGPYTVIVSGANQGTGIGIVEVFEVN
ncbi:MAG: hypothetical protein JKY88_08735, partial [Pseudomonadales bacterium]|nr:hypothetical protein [Pseudomonadales bacterium]